MSRFNHACRPNAFALNNNNIELIEIVTISSIKAGEEITISYDPSVMAFEKRKKKIRQESILKDRYFVCSCDLCLKEEDDNDDTFEELFNEIENLEEEELAAANLVHPAVFPPSNSKRQIECH